MKRNNTTAFTLVELIVVITILAILGTIAFLSLNGYANTARNSKRVSDLKLIEKSLSLYLQVEALYPNPDNATDISYSGGLAWRQGTFGANAISQVGRLSEIPKDPLFENQYTYSVLVNNKRFQIAGALEDSFFTYNTPLINSSYALSQEQMQSYITGDYTSTDVTLTSGTGCYTIGSPSIILSDIPPSGVLTANTNFNYTFSKSRSLPSSYESLVANNGSESPFQVRELLGVCRIETMDQLDLFVAKLSTVFQPLANFGDYERLIYNSNSLEFKKDTALRLIDQGVSIDSEVLKLLNQEAPSYSFVDSFTDSNGVELIGAHSPDTGASSWNFLSSSTPGAYTISGNTLTKNTSGDIFVSPVPNPVISSGDYSVSFEVGNFGGGTINIYLRYIDSDNYYKLALSSTGFQLIENIGGIQTAFTTLPTNTSPGDVVVFSVQGDSIMLTIDGNLESSESRSSSLSARGRVAISLQNSSATIDNFTFIYR